MREIFDEYCWTKHKKILTKREHGVSGLNNFAYWSETTAIEPSQIHYHADVIEVHCMVKGKRITYIEKDGSYAQYISLGNQAFLTFPFELHSNGEQPVAPCEFYAFQINIAEPSHLLGLNEENSRQLYLLLTNLEQRHFNLENTQQGYIRSAFSFFSERTPQSILIGSLLLACFLLGLPQQSPITDANSCYVDSQIKKAIDYLNANIHERIGLVDLANAAGYSLSHFKVKFRDVIGITPAEYITMQKLELAKKLLIETDMSITELAFSLGFSSSNYFSAVFKRTLSSTPRSYRRRYRLHG